MFLTNTALAQYSPDLTHFCITFTVCYSANYLDYYLLNIFLEVKFKFTHIFHFA